jgi:hypothetical protein
MEVFHGHTKPNLIEPVLQKRVRKLMRKSNEPSLLQKLFTYIKNFYYNYISPNKAFLIMLTAVIIFLYYRYKMTQVEKRKQLIKRKRKKLLKAIKPLQIKETPKYYPEARMDSAFPEEPWIDPVQPSSHLRVSMNDFYSLPRRETAGDLVERTTEMVPMSMRIEAPYAE